MSQRAQMTEEAFSDRIKRMNRISAADPSRARVKWREYRADEKNGLRSDIRGIFWLFLPGKMGFLAGF
jgi:hypothetical protein